VSLGFDIPVRDQGNCGSCWAQSSAGVLEWAQLIYQDKSQMLSTQQLVSCDKSVYGCSGGWFADGYVLKNGLAKEQDFPYQAKNLPCKSGLQAFAKPIDAMNIGENGKPTTEQLKEALMQFGPLSVSVAAGKGWSGFKGGKMSPCTNRGINHMVMIFGWDDSKGGWLMRNSWGKQWGTMGDALMPYGCDRIGEEAAVFLVKPIKEYN
jgi:C1A family cysteine protease